MPYNSISVTLISPNNNQIITDTQNVSFVYYPFSYGASRFYRASLMVNGSNVAINQTKIIDNGYNTIYYKFPSNGTYLWNVRVENETHTVLGYQNFILTVGYVDPSPTPTPTPTNSTSPTPAPTAPPTNFPTEKPTPTTTPHPTITPEPKPTPTISINCRGSSTASTIKVDITGQITYNGAAIPNAQIQLSYSVNSGRSWVDLTTAITNANGDFFEEWLPQASGSYLLKATYLGNQEYSSVTEVANFAITPYREQIVFSVTSNSTVSAFFFNSTSQEICFTVNGTSNTTGYVSIYVPKSLVGDAANLRVLLDGASIAYSATMLEDSILVNFNYHHSTHQVTISSNQPATPNQGANQTMLIVVVAVLAVVMVAVGLVVWRIKKPK